MLECVDESVTKVCDISEEHYWIDVMRTIFAVLY